MKVEKQAETLQASQKTGGAGDSGEQTAQPTTAQPESKIPEDLPAAYQKLLGEKQELYDRLLRTQAELENFRKRTQREKEEFLQHANADLIRSLLPVLDGFERAEQHRDPAVPEQFYKGLDLIYRQLLETLRRAGLQPVEAEGEIFNPEVHQAVETVEAEDRRDHEVVGELQRGYRLKQRLLRPAIVKVAVQPRKDLPEFDEEE
ncbi:MAG: nucleotide exchange factor GrpE [Terriglobia bacterium]